MASEQRQVLQALCGIHHFDQKKKQWVQLGSKDGWCKVVMNAEIKHGTNLTSSGDNNLHWGTGSAAYGLTFKSAAEKQKFELTTKGLQDVLRKQYAEEVSRKEKKEARAFPQPELEGKPKASVSTAASATAAAPVRVAVPAATRPVEERAVLVKEPQKPKAVEPVAAAPGAQSKLSQPAVQKQEVATTEPQVQGRVSPPGEVVEHAPLPEADAETFRRLINRLCADMDVRVETAVRLITLVLEDLRGLQLPEDIEAAVKEAAELEAPDSTDLDRIRSRTEVVTERISTLMRDVNDIAEDYQSRNWSSQNDTAEVMDVLQNIAEMLAENEEGTLEGIVDDGAYRGLYALVEFFIGETGTKEIRAMLLRVMGLMCAVVPEAPKRLAETELAVFLAKQIMVELTESAPDAAVNLLHYSLALGTVLFSSEADIALSMFEKLNEEFITFILKLIEGASEETCMASLHFILSFNLTFISAENIVTNALAARKDESKVFTEELMVLANDVEDPVGGNSVVKLLCDMYSRSDTANMLYTNDVAALCTVIARELHNLGLDSPLLTRYLHIYTGILKFTDYNGAKASEIAESLIPVVLGEAEGASEEWTDQCTKVLVKMRSLDLLDADAALDEILDKYEPEEEEEEEEEEEAQEPSEDGDEEEVESEENREEETGETESGPEPSEPEKKQDASGDAGVERPEPGTAEDEVWKWLQKNC